MNKKFTLSLLIVISLIKTNNIVPMEENSKAANTTKKSRNCLMCYQLLKY